MIATQIPYSVWDLPDEPNSSHCHGSFPQQQACKAPIGSRRSHPDNSRNIPTSGHRCRASPRRLPRPPPAPLPPPACPISGAAEQPAVLRSSSLRNKPPAGAPRLFPPFPTALLPPLFSLAAARSGGKTFLFCRLMFSASVYIFILSAHKSDVVSWAALAIYCSESFISVSAICPINY